MAVPIAELFVSISADVTGALAGLAAISRELARVEGEFQAATPAAVAFVAAGAGIGLALSGAVSDFANFDTKMTTIRNNTTMTDADMQAMRDTVLDLGAKGPAALDDIGEGFMHIFNFGFAAADATVVLDAAWKSAVSTGSNVSNTAEVLGGVLHAFNIPATQATATMNELHTAAAEGNLTLDEFNSSFGQLAAWASSVGVPLDQAAAAFSTLTRHQFDAATAGTQVKDQIEHMINPSKSAEKAIKDLSDRSGIDLVHAFSASGLQTHGLTGVMDMAHEAMNRLGLTQAQQTSEWMKLIPNIRGGAASFVLAGNGAEDYKEILAATDAQLLDTDAAFERVKQTLNFQWGTFTNQLKELGIAVGEVLSPRVADLIGVLSGFVDKIKQLPAPVLDALVNMLSVAGTVMLLTGTFVLLGPLLGALGASFGAFIGVLISAAPFILLVGGLAKLLSTLWQTNFMGIRTATENAFGNFPQVLGTITAAFDAITSGHGDQVLAWFKTLLPDALKDLGKGIGDSPIGKFLSVLAGLWAAIESGHSDLAIDWFRNQLPTAVNAGIDKITKDLPKFFSVFGSLVSMVLEGRGDQVLIFFRAQLPEAMKTFFDRLSANKPALDQIGNFFSALGSVLREITPDKIGAGANSVGIFFNVLGTSINNAFTPLAPLIPVFQSFGNFLGALVNAMRAIAQLVARSGGGPADDPLLKSLQGLADFATKNGNALNVLTVLLGPMGEAFKTLMTNSAGIATFFNDLATALNNFSAAVDKMPKLPDWMDVNPMQAATTAGRELATNPSFAIGPRVNTATGEVSNVPGNPLIAIGQIMFATDEQAKSWLKQMGDIIAQAANRVSRPPSNAGNPNLEPTGPTP